MYVENVSGDTLSVTRHNPVSHESVILIARTAFGHPHHLDPHGVRNVSIPGLFDTIAVQRCNRRV